MVPWRFLAMLSAAPPRRRRLAVRAMTQPPREIGWQSAILGYAYPTEAEGPGGVRRSALADFGYVEVKTLVIDRLSNRTSGGFLR